MDGKNNSIALLLDLQKRPNKYAAKNKMPSCEENNLVSLVDFYVIQQLLSENYTLKSILKAMLINHTTHRHYKHKLLSSKKSGQSIELDSSDEPQANLLYQETKSKLSDADLNCKNQASITLLDLYVIQRLVGEAYTLKSILNVMSINGPTYYKHRNRNHQPIKIDSSDEARANILYQKTKKALE